MIIDLTFWGIVKATLAVILTGLALTGVVILGTGIFFVIKTFLQKRMK